MELKMSFLTLKHYREKPFTDRVAQDTVKLSCSTKEAKLLAIAFLRISHCKALCIHSLRNKRELFCHPAYHQILVALLLPRGVMGYYLP
jgi:hypothetical protein